MSARYEIKMAEVAEGEPEQWYFNLVGGNGEVVATSELYPTKANAERGAAEAANASKEAMEDGE